MRFFYATLLTLSISLSASATSYTFQTLNAPGATITDPIAISNNGEVVGNYLDATGTHTFLYRAGVFQTVTYNGQSVSPIGINNQGQFVASTNNYSTFLEYSAGTFSVLQPPNFAVPPGIPPAPIDEVAGINDSGQILEKIYPYSPSGAALLVSGNSYTVLGNADNRTFLRGVNNNGDYIGIFYSTVLNPGSYQGFINISGQSQYFAGPDSLYESLYFYSINDSDQVVGSYGNTAFIYQNGVSTPFNYPGAAYSSLTGINDAGDLIGGYTLSDGSSFAFIATPTAASSAPEPASWALLALGLVICSSKDWRRSRSRS